MRKKSIIILLLIGIFLFNGCSCSKEDLINENTLLKEENMLLENENSKYRGVEDIFSFYNKITSDSLNSFVLVESSKSSGTIKYSDGVVIAKEGYYYYVLTDYYCIYQTANSPYQSITYKVMDKNATVYNAEVSTIYDVEGGLLLLRVSTLGHTNVGMKSIQLGEKSDLVAHVSSLEHINKIQMSEKIKTSTIEHNDASYNVYNIEDIIVNSGALLNVNNELCGLYLYNYNGFIETNLIKNIVNFIYQPIL